MRRWAATGRLRQPYGLSRARLLKLGVTDFASLSELTIFDLLEADIPREDCLRIAFARRHFDTAHTRPPGSRLLSQLVTGVNMLTCRDSSDTTLGESANETLANLHHIGFDMPISLPADWRDSFWLSEYEPWTVSGTFTGFSVR